MTDAGGGLRRQAWCHRLPDALKVLLSTAVVLASVLIPPVHWPAQGLLACLAFAGLTVAGVPLSYLLRRLTLFLPFLLLFALAVPLSQGGRAGWDVMAAILARGVVAFLAGLWLIAVLPFYRLLMVLQRWRCPAALLGILLFMYRYLFVLWDELETMRAARRARNFGSAPLPARWKTLAQLIGMLILRSMDRAERVHAAMCARGWDGELRFFTDDRQLR